MRVGVVDYGCGNLFSLDAGLERAGLLPVRVRCTQDAEGCKGLVVPGVGSFAAGMRGLEESGLAQFIKEWVINDRPTLGICLGMQLLFTGSDEANGVEGLSLIPGMVRKLWGPYAIPHMGWNYVSSREAGSFNEGFYYFVHSYYAELPESEGVVAYTCHNVRIPAAVKYKNTWGVQFHPEKSGLLGIKLLKEWGENLV